MWHEGRYGYLRCVVDDELVDSPSAFSTYCFGCLCYVFLQSKSGCTQRSLRFVTLIRTECAPQSKWSVLWKTTCKWCPTAPPFLYELRMMTHPLFSTLTRSNRRCGCFSACNFLLFSLVRGRLVPLSRRSFACFCPDSSLLSHLLFAQCCF